ncbi:hypothetical protein [Dactylosporangium sp. NPDC049140]|uniref:hypothetical protein n=1 Tax=Dactylosporangium sp. NPDC049140 TaxID=3155647 RepID=UPI0034004788
MIEVRTIAYVRPRVSFSVIGGLLFAGSCLSLVSGWTSATSSWQIFVAMVGSSVTLMSGLLTVPWPGSARHARSRIRRHAAPTRTGMVLPFGVTAIVLASFVSVIVWVNQIELVRQSGTEPDKLAAGEFRQSSHPWPLWRLSGERRAFVAVYGLARAGDLSQPRWLSATVEVRATSCVSVVRWTIAIEPNVASHGLSVGAGELEVRPDQMWRRSTETKTVFRIFPVADFEVGSSVSVTGSLTARSQTCSVTVRVYGVALSDR